MAEEVAADNGPGLMPEDMPAAEDSADEYPEDADQQGMEDEDFEEEEPEDDEELPPCAGDADLKDDTLQVLVDISEAQGFSEPSKMPHQSGQRGRGARARMEGGPADERGIDRVAAGSAASGRPQDVPRHEDAEDVGSVVVKEAVKWLLQKLYRRCDNSKLEKVPEWMTRCEGNEVFLLRSALRKYVSMPDNTHDGLEEKADLLQELLMGLADHFAVDGPAAVDLGNLGNSFLQELYQLLYKVKASRLRLLAAEPIEDDSQARSEERSYLSGPSQGVLGSFAPEGSAAIPEIPDKDCEMPLPQRWELYFAATVRRHREKWDPDLGEGILDGPEVVVEQPAIPARDSRPPKRARRGRDPRNADAREQGRWQLEKQTIEMFE